MTSRLMRLLALVVAVATLTLVGGVAAGSAGAAPPEVVGKKTVQVRGTANDGSKFNGQFTVTNFRQATASNAPSPVEAVGDLTGKLIHPGQGAAAQDVSQSGVAMPAAVAQASCEILDLVLGPLDLNLLGLEVHLDTVHLNITAVPGAGNLLGNLLCALFGLLDGPGLIPGIVNAIAALLNRLLAVLG